MKPWINRAAQVSIADVAKHIVLEVDLAPDVDQPSANNCGLTLDADGTLDGSWIIEVSNTNHIPGMTPKWTDITSSFTPVPVTVDHTNPTTQSQFVQLSPGMARSVRASLSSTGGSGKATAGAFAAVKV